MGVCVHSLGHFIVIYRPPPDVPPMSSLMTELSSNFTFSAQSVG